MTVLYKRVHHTAAMEIISWRFILLTYVPLHLSIRYISEVRTLNPERIKFFGILYLPGGGENPFLPIAAQIACIWSAGFIAGIVWTYYLKGFCKQVAVDSDRIIFATSGLLLKETKFKFDEIKSIEVLNAVFRDRFVMTVRVLQKDELALRFMFYDLPERDRIGTFMASLHKIAADAKFAMNSDALETAMKRFEPEK